MTYAIIKFGGKQIKVNAGSQVWVEKINIKEGEKYIFKEVLAISNGIKLTIGKPTLEAEVIAKVEKQGKGPKIQILRTKAKSNWKRLQGHRQPYTRLLIEEIILDGKLIAKAEVKSLVKKNEMVKETIVKTKKPEDSKSNLEVEKDLKIEAELIVDSKKESKPEEDNLKKSSEKTEDKFEGKVEI